MKYAAVIEYISDAQKIDSVRPTHRAYLSELLAKGQLAATGPFTDGWGALIVYVADSPEQAEALLKADPFHAAGIFVRWTIRPWKVVMAQPDIVG
jgi:uncharacterized protein YciI